MGSITALSLLLTDISGNDIAVTHRLKKDPSWLSLNWSEGSKWKEAIECDHYSTLNSICLKACFAFVSSNTTLSRLAGIGRSALTAVLSSDELQVFRNARLLDEVPDQKVLNWWNYFKVQARINRDATKTEQGLIAEYWTMLLEQNYVGRFTSGLSPRWISLDGDHFGYDIKSYRVSGSKIKPVLIEVKSFASKVNPYIYITRNEWLKSIVSKQNYIFYVWCMEDKKHIQLTPEELFGLIPHDTELGVWENAKLNVSAWW